MLVAFDVIGVFESAAAVVSFLDATPSTDLTGIHAIVCTIVCLALGDTPLLPLYAVKLWRVYCEKFFGTRRREEYMGSGGDALDIAEGIEVAHPIASWLLAKVRGHFVCCFVV